MNQLALFQGRLPQKPYHTDDLTNGLAIVKAQHALKSRYIQPNGPTHKYWLVFDVDRSTATLDWYDLDAPAPNIIVTNPTNGHAHLIYGLEVSIRTAPDGKSQPLRYAAAVENALREKLGSDMGYVGLVCKNPLHAYWRVSTWENNLYTLDWLADYLDLSAYNNQKRLPDYGLGRNCNLFEYLSKWSYKAIRQGYPDYDQWFEACFTRAMGYNKKQFPEPLTENEVKHTAKSVAKWTHKHFSSSGFSAWQAKQGAKGGKISKGGGRPPVIDTENAQRIELMLSMEFEQKEIAERLGLGLATIERHIASAPNVK